MAHYVPIPVALGIDNVRYTTLNRVPPHLLRLCELQHSMAQILQDYLVHALAMQRQIHCAECPVCIVN